MSMKVKSAGATNSEHMDEDNYSYRIFIGSNAEKARYDELMEYHRDSFEKIFSYLFVNHKDSIMEMMKDVMYKHCPQGKLITKKAIINGRKIEFSKAYNGMEIFASNGNKTTKINSRYSDLTGKKASDFTLKNINNQEISLSKYKGKKVILTFFTTPCPSCKEEMAVIEKVYKNRDDIEIIAVNIGEKKETVQKFIKEYNLSYIDRILLSNNSIVTDYKVKLIPTTYFIDNDGYIYTFHSGKLTYTEIVNIIKHMK